MVEKTKITEYMQGLVKSNADLDNVTLHGCFIYSLQVITDDISDTSKYWYLTYFEYLEYICRIALINFKDRKGEKDGKIEFKVLDFF